MTVTVSAADDPARYAAEVIREAITCDRQECGPWTHTTFVEDNLSIAREAINEQARGGAR